MNVKLKTYAEYKIRGAILDSLRGLDRAPRQQRKRSKQIEAAIASARKKVKRAPTEEEIAAELRITIEEYYEWLIDVRAINLGSFEYGSGDEEGHDLLRYISDDEEQWPSRLLERSELQKVVASAIENMPRVERTVITLYYYEELTLPRDLTRAKPARITDLATQVASVLRLRTVLEKRWPSGKGI